MPILNFIFQTDGISSHSQYFIVYVWNKECVGKSTDFLRLPVENNIALLFSTLKCCIMVVFFSFNQLFQSKSQFRT